MNDSYDDFFSPKKGITKAMYLKTKQGHAKVVERLQRQVLTQKIVQEEQHKKELKEKAERFMKMQQLLNRVKDPQLKLANKSFDHQEKPKFYHSGKIEESPLVKMTSTPERPHIPERQVSLNQLTPRQKQIKVKLTRMEATERLRLRKEYNGKIPLIKIEELKYQHSVRRYEMAPELFPRPMKSSSLLTPQKKRTEETSESIDTSLSGDKTLETCELESEIEETLPSEIVFEDHDHLELPHESTEACTDKESTVEHLLSEVKVDPENVDIEQINEESQEDTEAQLPDPLAELEQRVEEPGEFNCEEDASIAQQEEHSSIDKEDFQQVDEDVQTIAEVVIGDGNVKEEEESHIEPTEDNESHRETEEPQLMEPAMITRNLCEKETIESQVDAIQREVSEFFKTLTTQHDALDPSL